MKSIIIIIPYFGPFPKQFKFWLQSAQNNQSIDYLIITDNKIARSKNINVIDITFNEFKALVQSKFDFPITINTPYKICDFRGAYGYIFRNFVKGYDFWGFGDLDLVYGNIRTIITEEILNEYKVILGLGHLTLYQNSEICNHFFETKIDNFQYYKDSFSNPQNTVFDEFLHGGLSDMWKFKFPELLWEYKPFDDILVPRLSFNFTSVFNREASNHLIFEYSDKNLYRVYVNSENQIVKEPTLYAHFQQRNFMSVKTDNTDNYLIIPNSYIEHEEITISKLYKWTKARTAYRHCWNLKNRVKRRLKIILSKIQS